MHFIRIVRSVAIALFAFSAACSGAPDSNSPDYVIDNSTSRAPSQPSAQPTAAAPAPTPAKTSTPAPTTTPEPPQPPAGLVNGDFSAGLTGWTGSGNGFGTFKRQDGTARVTTFVPPANEKVVGKLWQDFTVPDDATELRFLVHGGDARVQLMSGTSVLAWTQGQRNNADQPVVWPLTAYRGEKLRVMIDDSVTTDWGFVGAGAFTVD